MMFELKDSQAQNELSRFYTISESQIFVAYLYYVSKREANRRVKQLSCAS